MKADEIVLTIPDLHHPFAHKDAHAFLKYLKLKFKPTTVVCLGDELDFHALSRWTADPDGWSAGHELERALESMEGLYSLFPTVKVCTSNHTIRPFKRALDAGIPRKIIRDYREFLGAPDTWVWRDKWIIDDIIYEHGENLSGKYAQNRAASQNLQSTVFGHVHTFAGIHYLASHNRLLFGFNVGCLIDLKSYAMAYGSKFRNKPVLGAGIVDKGVPQFYPMILDGHGRWIGRI